MKYKLFIGRWSPFHNGHKTIIDSFVDNGTPVCILIRDSKEKWNKYQRVQMIEAVYKEQVASGMVVIRIIPDIDMVCIGRKVGYGIVEVPDEIKKISGTDIRAGKCDDLPEEVKELIKFWEERNWMLKNNKVHLCEICEYKCERANEPNLIKLVCTKFNQPPDFCKDCGKKTKINRSTFGNICDDCWEEYL